MRLSGTQQRMCRFWTGRAGWRLCVGLAERLRFFGAVAVVTAARVVTVFDEPVVQRLQTDAENLRCTRLDAAALLERRENQLTVRLGERRTERNRDRGARGRL